MDERRGPQPRLDLAILGGGLAGLSLAANLARHGYGGRVVVLEPRSRYRDDRSWSFWAPDDHPQVRLAECSWQQWAVGLDGEAAQTRRAAGWRYRYVRSDRVYADALSTVARAPGIELRLGSGAGSLGRAGDGLRVDTDAGPLFAAQVVDTRPAPPAQQSASTLFQVFAGREVVAAEDRFDADTVELMTDLRCDRHGIAFSYVLPLSRRRALVEVTRFARTPLPRTQLEHELDALIGQRGWSGAAGVRSEYATLPMGLPAPVPALPGVVLAGVGGGGLRAASGYGFLRIRDWAERCAQALCRGGAAIGHPPEPPLQRWMDRLFLQVLQREPERGPALFARLASRVDAAAYVRFMSDRASLLDQARIVAALPPMPFLRAAFENRPTPAGSPS